MLFEQGATCNYEPRTKNQERAHNALTTRDLNTHAADCHAQLSNAPVCPRAHGLGIDTRGIAHLGHGRSEVLSAHAQCRVPVSCTCG